MERSGYDILNVLADAIVIIDRQHTIVFANQAIGKITNIAQEKIIGKKCYDLFHNRDLPCDEISLQGNICNYAEVFNSGLPIKVIHHHTLVDGTTIILEITTSPMKNNQGEVYQIIMILKDVTLHEKLRESSRAAREELELIFNNAPFSIVYLDCDMRVVRLNPIMEKIAGYSLQEARGRHCYNLWGQYAADDAKKGTEKICDVCHASLSLRDGRRYQYEREVAGRIYEIVSVPVRDSNKTIIGVIEIGRDINERKKTEEALRTSEIRYKILFEESPVPLLVADFSSMKNHLESLKQKGVSDLREYFTANPDAADEYLTYIKILDCNKATLKMFQIESKEALWNNLERLLIRIPLHESPEGLVAISRGETTFAREITTFTMGNRRLRNILRWSVEPGFEDDYSRVLLSLTDITDRQKHEEALRRYADRLEAVHDVDQAILQARSTQEIAAAAIEKLNKLINCEGSCVLLFDPDHNVCWPIASNAQKTPTLCELKSVAFQCQNYMDHLHKGETFLLENIDPVMPSCDCPITQDLIKLGIHYFMSIPMVSKDGLIGALNIFDREVSCLQPDEVEIAHEIAAMLTVAIKDARLLEAVTQHENELRNLNLRLAEAEEMERRRVAHALHDDVGQNLTALGINLQILKNNTKSQGTGHDRTRLIDSIKLVETMTEQIRSVMADLRPPVLDDYGLLASLRWLGQTVSQRTGLRINVTGLEPEPRLPPAKETALYRIAQEALINAIKHAEPLNIDISISPDKDMLRLEIMDDGNGFDQDRVKSTKPNEGLGLVSIKERTMALGGRFHLATSPGNGTRITVELPL